MSWSMTKPKRKKKRKQPKPSDEFRNIKGPRRESLIAARKAKKLTQVQLANLVGCSSTTISHLELGRMKPGLELSMQLEQVLETPFTKLFPDL